MSSGSKATRWENARAFWNKPNGVGTDIMPVPTPIFLTVGPAEGVSVFGGQGVGLQRSSCRSAAAYTFGAWCRAQRIKIAMIAGGNHTIINDCSQKKWPLIFFTSRSRVINCRWDQSFTLRNLIPHFFVTTMKNIPISSSSTSPREELNSSTIPVQFQNRTPPVAGSKTGGKIQNFFFTDRMLCGGDKRDRTADLLNAMSAIRGQNEY